MRGNQRTRKGGTAPPVPVDGQDRQQAGGVTDAKGKGLAPVWRDLCAGPNRTRGRQAEQWQNRKPLDWRDGMKHSGSSAVRGKHSTA